MSRLSRIHVSMNERFGRQPAGRTQAPQYSSGFASQAPGWWVRGPADGGCGCECEPVQLWVWGLLVRTPKPRFEAQVTQPYKTHTFTRTTHTYKALTKTEKMGGEDTSTQ